VGELGKGDNVRCLDLPDWGWESRWATDSRLDGRRKTEPRQEEREGTTLEGGRALSKWDEETTESTDVCIVGLPH
jgi:hypothetical protein